MHTFKLRVGLVAEEKWQLAKATITIIVKRFLSYPTRSVFTSSQGYANIVNYNITNLSINQSSSNFQEIT